ncbi:MAG TPA: AI-2E family transporter [Kofleriaceae bacterium]|nr:AI-2E family transporter [Kofleriaceae bacterium]
MLLAIGVVAAVWLLGRLTAVLAVIAVALVVVGTAAPVVAWLGRHGFRRGRALVLVFAVAALVFVAAVLLMIPPLLAQSLDLLANAPRERDQLVHAISGYAGSDTLVRALDSLPLHDIDTRAAKSLVGYSSQVLGFIGYGISSLFLAVYLLADPARAKGILYAAVPRHHHVKLSKVLLELEVIVGGYVRGQLITSAAIALFVFVVLTLCGARNALALALFAGLTDIIPFVGGYIASTPVVLAVTPDGLVVAIVVAVLMVMYQEFESRILVPRVYGKTLRLAPALVVVALLVGGTVGGILGALLALPIAAGLQMLIRELRVALPGEVTADEPARQLDEQATEAYERLTADMSAADAAAVADDLASMLKRAEQGGPPLSQQLPHQ